MDAVFVNGTINTLDPGNTVVEALAVSGGRVAALGRERDLRALAGPETEVIDMQGGAMFPGFIDCHTHLMIFSYLLDGLDLSPQSVSDVKGMVDLVGQEARSLAPGEWIRGSRFAEYWLAENRYPTRYDLDPVSPNHPVILYHTSFHACVLNTKGLEELGLTPETPVPVGGIIERDESTGELTGVLHDAAMMDLAFSKLFNHDLATMDRDRRVRMCSQGMAEFAKVGVTAVSDCLVTPASLEVYQDTLAAGEAKVRVYLMPEIKASEGLMESGLRTGFGNDWLRLGPIKIFEDGGMSNRTAAVGTPYLTPPYGQGLKVLPREEMIAAVQRIHALGFQIAVHCQGDDGLTDTLDAFESVLSAESDNPLRHRIEHAGCLYPHLLKRAAAMSIGVASQPTMYDVLGDGWLEAFGPEGMDRLYPLKSMLAAGMPVGGSSDCPVVNHNPLLGLKSAILRRTAKGHVFGEHEALTMDQALRMYTKGSAYVNREDHICGTIEPGKRADFTVLGADPREVEVEEVEGIPVVMTVVGGGVTYSRGR